MDLGSYAHLCKVVRDEPGSLLASDIDAFKSTYGYAGSINARFTLQRQTETPKQPNFLQLEQVVKKKLVSNAVSPARAASPDRLNAVMSLPEGSRS